MRKPTKQKCDYMRVSVSLHLYVKHCKYTGIMEEQHISHLVNCHRGQKTPFGNFTFLSSWTSNTEQHFPRNGISAKIAGRMFQNLGVLSGFVVVTDHFHCNMQTILTTLRTSSIVNLYFMGNPINASNSNNSLPDTVLHNKGSKWVVLILTF